MSSAYEKIKRFLLSENIDVFSALKAEKLNIINEKKMPDGAKSAVVFLIPYYTGEHRNRNISLYAISRDYHLFIKELGERFEADGEHYYRFFADSSPIDERQAALDSGLGIKGQNRLLINEKYGSYVFIASIITDAVFDGHEYVSDCEEKHCPDCGSCIKKCAFLDRRREFCLSELNQRKKVTAEELDFIKSHSLCWGCDDCQTVCPLNKNASKTPVEFFYKDIVERITTELIHGMQDKEFSERAYSWRGRRVILRNLGEDDGEGK